MKFRNLFVLFAIPILLNAQDSRTYNYYLIHGLNSSSSVWNNTLIENYILNELKHDNVIKINYKKNAGSHVTEIVDRVKNSLHSGSVDEKILIGHSMGGLVAREYIKQYGPANISTVVTIGTPHLGSELASAQGKVKAARIVWNTLAATVGIMDEMLRNYSKSYRHWYFRQLWEDFERKFTKNNVVDLESFIQNIAIDLLYNYGLEYATDKITMTLPLDLHGGMYDAMIDLSPNSNFLSDLNSSQDNETLVDRFSIIGVEHSKPLYRLIGESIFNNEVYFQNFISTLHAAYISSIAMTQDNMNSYKQYMNVALQYYRYYLSMSNSFMGDDDDDNSMAEFYAYKAEVEWDVFNYYHYEWQFQAQHLRGLRLARDLIVKLPNEWDLLLGSHKNDAIVSDLSQKWPTTVGTNQFVAIGANHMEEINHPAVKNQLQEISKQQSFRLSDEARPPRPISANIINDLEIGGGFEYISAGTTIKNGATLTLNKGAVIKFEEDAKLIIEGGAKLLIKGTPTVPVRFTSAGNYEWGGVKFENDASNQTILQNVIIEKADIGVHLYKANPTIKNSIIKNCNSAAILLYESTATVESNTVQASQYGIYAYSTNQFSTQPLIKNNTISACDYGIRLTVSSPHIQGNEISGCTYGIYCFSSSSPSLGTFDLYGRNYIHNNGNGIYATASNPFLGQDYCGINGGNNHFENNTDHLYATNNAHIIAEKNWWGSASPSSSLFYSSSNASIDYTPHLTSAPDLNAINNSASPEEQLFEKAFSSTTDNSTLTEAEAMANFDDNWPFMRQLKFANNLVLLGFPNSAHKICKAIIADPTAGSMAYLAYDILWKAGRVDEAAHIRYRSYSDSISNLTVQTEIEEHIEATFSEAVPALQLSKGAAHGIANYKAYRHPAVAANVLLTAIEKSRITSKDNSRALEILQIMMGEFAGQEATKEAMRQLNIKNSAELNEALELPQSYHIAQNYPNPFNIETSFSITLPQAAHVKIEIYNTTGQVVRVLEGRDLQTGSHQLSWNGKSAAGNVVSTGMYFYKFSAVSVESGQLVYEQTRKMVLIK